MPFYAEVCCALLSRVAEQLSIIIDWSNLKIGQLRDLLWAPLTVNGRSLTLHEDVHAKNQLVSRSAQTQFQKVPMPMYRRSFRRANL